MVAGRCNTSSFPAGGGGLFAHQRQNDEVAPGSSSCYVLLQEGLDYTSAQ